MSNPILLVRDAGRGETPPCPDAKFPRGSVVRWPRLSKDFEGIVAAPIPSGFPAEYALADLLGEARPLMITRPSRSVTYILVREGDPTPYLAKERDLRATDKPSVDIGSVTREPSDA